MTDYTPPPPAGHGAPASLGAPEKAAGPDIMTFVIPILRSWPMIGILAVIGMVGGVAFSLTKPNEYTSVGKLLTKRQLPDQFADIEGKNLIGNSPENWAQTFADPRVSRRVAEIVGPIDILTPYDPAADDSPTKSDFMRKMHEIQSWWFGADNIATIERNSTPEGLLEAAARVLKAQVTIAPIRNSGVYSVSYTSHNKKLAQRVVKTFMEVCRRRELEVNQPHAKSLELLQQREAAAHEAAVQAEAALRTFLDEHAIFDYERQMASRLEEQGQLRRQLDQYESDLRLWRTQLAKLEKQIAETDEIIVTELPRQRFANPDYSEARQKRLNREFALEQAETQYTLDSEQYKLARRRFEQAVEVLDNTPQWIIEPPEDEPANTQETINPAYTNLVARRDALQGQIEEATARVTHLAPALPIVTKRVEELQKCQQTLRTLTTAAAENRASADAFSSELQRGEVAQELVGLGISKLVVLHEADLPFQKSGPKRLKFVLAGLAAGLFAGLGIASVRGFLDRTIRRPKDLEEVLGIKVLGVVPYSSGWKRARRDAQGVPNDRMTTHV